MNEVSRIIQERQSARVPFDPNQKVSKEDLEANFGGGPMDAYSPQHAKL